MSWLHRFYDKRQQMPLGRQNIYVFFSRNGAVYAFLITITFITGVNYANNLVLSLCFYLVALWLWAVCMSYMQLSGLSIKVSGQILAMADDLITVRLSITPKRTAHTLELSFDDAHKTRLLAEGQTTVVLSLPPKSRGVYQLPRLFVGTVYPLGISRAWSYVRFDDEVLVYPRPAPVGCQGSGRVADLGDFDRLDSYKTGESLARLSWRHMARGQKLTKHFSDEAKSPRVDINQMSAPFLEGRLAQMSGLVLQQSGAFCFVLDDEKVGQGHDFVQACLADLARYG